eukprot:10932077-Alexandrium_andersonii.AAC.1
MWSSKDFGPAERSWIWGAFPHPQTGPGNWLNLVALDPKHWESCDSRLPNRPNPDMPKAWG